MLEIELYKDEVGIDPPANVATDAEIEFADRLLRQLEARYLARSTPSSPGSAGPSCGEGK